LGEGSYEECRTRCKTRAVRGRALTKCMVWYEAATHMVLLSHVYFRQHFDCIDFPYLLQEMVLMLALSVYNTFRRKLNTFISIVVGSTCHNINMYSKPSWDVAPFLGTCTPWSTSQHQSVRRTHEVPRRDAEYTTCLFPEFIRMLKHTTGCSTPPPSNYGSWRCLFTQARYE
jgi:hypothetical protein